MTLTSTPLKRPFSLSLEASVRVAPLCTPDVTGIILRAVVGLIPLVNKAIENVCRYHISVCIGKPLLPPFMYNLKYLGSFLFDAGGPLSRSEFVRSKLRSMKSYSCYKPITLCISISGVKTVFMAHALRRISYATCDPASCSFAFLAREASADAPDQYCHIFATESPVKVLFDSPPIF
ncbi:unnamed protein product [Dibothriocephalus latus]|uniref:PID domain-containing protein n=1 Tax=Dibothriocephalus latus TaxID=60516 RepID=A0A3P7LQ73_DIBLA|nr:unnamed protein product [Dibothriocephalus latus]